MSTSHLSMMPYAWHTIGQEEIDAVVRVLKTGPLTCGPEVEEFENAFAEYIGCRHAVAVSSGTMALVVSLYALNIGSTNKARWADKKEGFSHEVIMPSLTMAATAESVIMAGAKPKFADINPDTLQIDIASAEALITPKTRAIIPVHYGGQTADMASIEAMAQHYDLVIIEDAAHAFGAVYPDTDTMVGSRQGALACFSFHPCKHICTCEGGMITTSDQRLANLCRKLRWFGLEKARSLDATIVVDIGVKGNMTDMQAAMGTEQLRKAPQFVMKRKSIAKQYHEAFADANLDGIRLPKWDWANCSWHLFPILVWRNRDSLKEALKKKGIGTAIHYHPLHLHPWFKTARSWIGFKDSNCPNAEAVGHQVLSLPMWPGLEKNDIDRVVDNVVKAASYRHGQGMSLRAPIQEHRGDRDGKR